MQILGNEGDKELEVPILHIKWESVSKDLKLQLIHQK